MNVYLDMVGCRLNQAEIEGYARCLRAAGHSIVAAPEKADMVILNSCSVTGEAASDSRQKIRQAAHAGAKVVVTGCWSSLEPDTARSLPGVNMVIPNSKKDSLVEQVLGHMPLPLEDLGREPLAGSRRRTRAFIKVQDGCDNHCTYCITRVARGQSSSRSTKEIVEEIGFASAGSTREAVLTGVQIGSWGKDMDPSLRLSDLIGEILTHTEIPRLRISSIEPWEIDDGLITLWKDPRLCRHLHIPLQSGSERILKRMARKTEPGGFLDLIGKLRRFISGVSITTDIIVGFPGETEQDFLQSIDFVRKANFSGGHVFIFSARPGTPAAGYPDQVPIATRRQRSRELRELLNRQAQAYRERFVGQSLDILWERSICQERGCISSGYSDNYIRVKASTSTRVPNQIDRVRIAGTENGCLIGEVVRNER